MPNFPGSLDSLANPTATTLRNDPGFELHAVISTLNDIAEQLEAKLGIGASSPGASAGVLRRTASGASAWGQVAAGDIVAGVAGLQYINAVGPVGSNTISFDFTAIPQTYRSLRIILQGRSSAAAASDTGALRINGLASALYFDQTIYAQGAIVGGQENLGVGESRCFALAGNTAPASYAGTVVIDIPNYAAPGSGLVKSWIAVGGLWYGTATGAQQVRTTLGGYSGTPAITQVTLFPLGGQFMPGSYAALYGLS